MAKPKIDEFANSIYPYELPNLGLYCLPSSICTLHKKSLNGTFSKILQAQKLLSFLCVLTLYAPETKTAELANSVDLIMSHLI